MLCGNKVDSSQKGHQLWAPSGNTSRFVLWFLFTYQCTVFSHVLTLLVFRLVSAYGRQTYLQQLSGYYLTPLHLALYLPRFCAVVLRHISDRLPSFIHFKFLQSSGLDTTQSWLVTACFEDLPYNIFYLYFSLRQIPQHVPFSVL